MLGSQFHEPVLSSLLLCPLVGLQGTLNLIAAAKRKGVKRFVFVTSIGADDVLNPLNLFWGVSGSAGGRCREVANSQSWAWGP